MGSGLSKTQVLGIAGSTFVIGIGVAYAPMPTSVCITGAFLLAIWWFAGHRRLRYSRSNHVASAGTDAQVLHRDLSGKAVAVFLLVWWSAALLLQRVGTSAVMDEWNTSQGAQQAAAEGNLANQLLIVSYGAVGMFFFVSAVKRQSKTLQWILVFSLLYLCWGWMSLLWSVDPFLTARRLVAFTLVWLASIGFGAGFYGSRPDGRRLFLHHVMVAGVLAALALVVPWILRGGLGNVLDPAYVLRPASDTYSLVANPALIATLVMIVTPLLNLRRWRRYDWLLLLVLGLAVFVLKTRGPFLAAVLALGVVYLCYKIWSAKWLLPIGLLLASSYSVYILYLGGALEWLLPYLTRNEGYSNVSSLTGRLPLWETVIFDAKQHLLGGVGFGAYWNPSNLARIEQIVGFTATVAENGYLDELLATGIIGLSLLLTFWTYITVAAIDSIRHGDNFGWIVVLFVVFYLLQNATFSIMQQYFEAPFIVLLILAGLMAGNRGEEPHYPVSPSKIVRHTPM